MRPGWKQIGSQKAGGVCSSSAADSTSFMASVYLPRSTWTWGRKVGTNPNRAAEACSFILRRPLGPEPQPHKMQHRMHTIPLLWLHFHQETQVQFHLVYLHFGGCIGGNSGCIWSIHETFAHLILSPWLRICHYKITMHPIENAWPGHKMGYWEQREPFTPLRKHKSLFSFLSPSLWKI